jgi:hypothetical protein
MPNRPSLGLLRRRCDQAGTTVGGDQLNAGQSACGEVAGEREPAGPVLAAGDLQPEDLPVPVGVHW